MARSQRLSWASSNRAQAEADAAFRAAVKSSAAKKAARRAKKRPKSSGVFKGTYQQYMKSSQWARKRAKARKHYGNKCCRCNSPHDLQVHHRHYRTLFREPMADLELLCRGCHQNEHEGDKPGVLDPMTREFLSLRF